MLPPRRRRRGRALLWVLAVIILVPVAGFAGLTLLLRTDVVRPRLIAAVSDATGQSLTLGGPVAVKLSLVPTITLDAVSLADAPGQPPILEAKRIEAELALLPLFTRRVELRRLTLIEPTLRLATGTAPPPAAPAEPPANAPAGDAPATPGTAPAPGDTAQPPAPPPPTPVAVPSPQDPVKQLDLAIAAIDIEKGRLIWQDRATGTDRTVDIDKLSLTDSEPGGPAQASGRLVYKGLAIDVTAETGPLRRLLPGAYQADEPAWPLRLNLAAEGIQAVLEGTLSHPSRQAGLRTRLHLALDNTSRLTTQPAFADLPRDWILPAEGLDATIGVTVEDGAPAPRFGPIRFGAAAIDLSRFKPGLTLRQLDLSAPAIDAPLRVTVEAGPPEATVHVSGEGPTPQALGQPGPWPLRFALEGPRARLTAEGSLAGQSLAAIDLPGSAFNLSLNADDTAALPGLLGLPTAPPAGAPASGTGRLGFAADGTIALQGLTLQGAAGDVAGDLSWRPGPRPLLTANLTSSRIAFEALLASLPSAPPPRPTGAAPGATAPTAAPATPPRPGLPGGNPRGGATITIPGANSPPPPEPEGGVDRVIPPLPVSLAPLKALNADLRWQVTALEAGGLTWRDLTLALALRDGILQVEPLAVTVPGGRLDATIGADSNGPLPAVSLKLKHEGQGIDMAQLMPALGYAGRFAGRLELDADLYAKGADLRAMAASLDGHLGLASANGNIDNSFIDAIAGDLRKMVMPQGIGGGGTTLRCLAVRLDSEKGMVRPKAMLLETSQLSVLGSGQIDLGQERLNLRLLPQLQISGMGIAAPVRVTGPLGAPAYRLDNAGVANAAAGILGELLGKSIEGNTVAGALVPNQATRTAAADCAQQLGIARGGRAGPIPAAEPRPATNRQNRPQDLLRGLLGR